MNIILAPEILDTYFSNKSKLRKKEHERALELALEEDNELLFTESTLKDFEDYFSDNNKYDLFTKFLLESIDNNCIRKEPALVPKNETIQKKIISLYNNTKAGYPLVLINADDAEIKKGIKETDLYIYSKTTKSFSNVGYIKLELAGRKIISLEYSDFKTDEDIRTFIENFFLIKSNIIQDIVHIFNRESNCHDHNLFNFLCRKAHTLNYYTKNFNSENTKKPIDTEIHTKNLKDLKKYFGKNLNYLLTNDPNLIHERRIIIDSISLTSDDDFNNVSVKRKTWRLTLTFDKDKNDIHIEKGKKFKVFTLR